ncbi:MauE/DoxX family redox-associated membrane protein [Streptomyces echinatus]|uniref:Putative membrane protein YphA (DoxX/SURF4 family) n=1 Tax=Streptomyces echinatus TaxID=67293 RepID=A0A7W9PR79_9ACTN|nr:MauE/DoxX family redox-associated membrane protein [Streptomyces echinatus]MBB5926453.1 putative membrane protein YphA (DoxX/SURF4 family) [Streptomyces echinatus]
MNYFAYGVRGLLTAVFLIAVAGKVGRAGAFSAFADSLRPLAAVSGSVVRAAALAVVAAECAVCLALILPFAPATLAGLPAATGLLTVFTVGIARSVGRGTTVRCRCFGRSAAPLGRAHVVRNGLLAAVAGAGVVATVVSGPAGGTDPGMVAVAWCAGAVAGGLITVAEDLVSLFRPVAPSVTE